MFEVHLTWNQPMRIFHGGNGKLRIPLQILQKALSETKTPSLGSRARDDVRQRPSRPGRVWRRQSFPSRAAAVIASWCLFRRGAALQNLKLTIVIHDVLTSPPDDRFAAVVTMRNFPSALRSACAQPSPDKALHMTPDIVSPDSLRRSFALRYRPRDRTTRILAVCDQRCAHFPFVL